MEKHQDHLVSMVGTAKSGETASSHSKVSPHPLPPPSNPKPPPPPTPPYIHYTGTDETLKNIGKYKT